MSSRPFHLRYHNDFMADTVHLSLTEVGAYERLLDYQYSERRGLDPNERSSLRIAGSQTRVERQAVLKVLNEFFKPREDDGGRLWNKRAYQQLTKNAAARKKMAEAGRKGAEKRWGPPSGTPPPENEVPHADPHADRNGVAMVRARDQIPYKDLDQNNRVPGSGSNLPRAPAPPPAREASGGGFSSEQQAERERLQRDLEAARIAEGIDPAPALRSVGSVAGSMASRIVAMAARGDPESNPESNPEPGNPED